MTLSEILQCCSRAITLSLLMALAACEDGPKTYDACMLKASKDSKTDHQFQVMSKACREQFQTKFQ